MSKLTKRYSKYITPTLFILDFLIINSIIYWVADFEFLNPKFLLYANFLWLFSSYLSGLYKLYRSTTILQVFRLLIFQFILFFFGYFAYFSIFREGVVVNNQFKVLSSIFIVISIVKISSFYLLKKYRASGKNLRKIVIIGVDDAAQKMAEHFQNNKGLGYHFLGFFSEEAHNSVFLKGSITESFAFILENEVDEIYCTLSVLKQKQLSKIKKFATEYERTVKLIPDANALYSKTQEVEYFNDTYKVLNIKKMPFEFTENRIIKRIFDIFFSLFVIVFIMSWLTPILWILIKSETKGPLFFKQEREGINARKFMCYKFRSMRVNKNADKVHATKNDSRVTKMGAFIRKTSIDELPQFFNVFLGDMSVVGPRPHLESLALEYELDVENYLERHAVKPGITGLAQVNGYRGEIKTINDIKNRVRLDVFYIENWSFLLDIKIIVQTVFNMFKEDEKAY